MHVQRFFRFKIVNFQRQTVPKDLLGPNWSDVPCTSSSTWGSFTWEKHVLWELNKVAEILFQAPKKSLCGEKQIQFSGREVSTDIGSLKDLFGIWVHLQDTGVCLRWMLPINNLSFETTILHMNMSTAWVCQGYFSCLSQWTFSCSPSPWRNCWWRWWFLCCINKSR